MVLIIRQFKNHLGDEIKLDELTFEHIQDRHPEINLFMIEEALKEPDLVLMSNRKPEIELYFIKKVSSLKERYTLVVVKNLKHEQWICTSMTKSKISDGTILYRKHLC